MEVKKSNKGCRRNGHDSLHYIKMLHILLINFILIISFDLHVCTNKLRKYNFVTYRNIVSAYG